MSGNERYREMVKMLRTKDAERRMIIPQNLRFISSKILGDSFNSIFSIFSFTPVTAAVLQHS